MKVISGNGFKLTSYTDDWLSAFKATEDETLVTGAGGIAREAKQRLRPQLSRAQTGQLSRSIGFNQPHDESGRRVVDVGITGAAADGEPAFHYALAVEFGRKPGKPPPSKALYRFVRMVLRPKPEAVAKQRARISTKQRQENLIKSVAFLVARSIGKKGIKPRPYLKPSFDRIWPMMLGIFREKLAARLARLPKPKF